MDDAFGLAGKMRETRFKGVSGIDIGGKATRDESVGEEGSESDFAEAEAAFLQEPTA